MGVAIGASALKAAVGGGEKPVAGKGESPMRGGTHFSKLPTNAEVQPCNRDRNWFKLQRFLRQEHS